MAEETELTEQKSSNEIISELFSSFNVDPPTLDTENHTTPASKKHKKSKKKVKHKKKKSKKKSKRKRNNSSSSDESSDESARKRKRKKLKEKSEHKKSDKSTSKKSDDDCIIESLQKIVTESSKAKCKEKGEKVPGDCEDSDIDHRKNGKTSSKHKSREHKSKSRDRTHRSSRHHRSRSNDKHSRSTKDDHDHRSSHAYRSRSREKHRYVSRRSRSRSPRTPPKKDRPKYSASRNQRASSPSLTIIDKKKLLEIARKNAINMLKSGTLPDALTLGPQAQEKVIAAIKAGGKSLEELTSFCKNLSKKEAMGELSSMSSTEEDNVSDNEKVFHHPFQIKDKPSSIVMNIKNAVPLPTRSLKEKSQELLMQFPVSSGQLHRKTENEWVPVIPKKQDLASIPFPALMPAPIPKSPVVTVSSELLAIEAPPLPSSAPPATLNIPDPKPLPNVDIASIVSQRLSAMRKLQENPNDTQALSEMNKVQNKVQSWAQSKQQPGQFTGTTGVQILSAAELSSGYQAWARKDQLQTGAPLTGGMGMHLLQKMGWKPGEGLGKEKSGQLEPLLLEVKLDKKGLVATEEVKAKRLPKAPRPPAVKTLAGKHPVSLLGEFATKRKLGTPVYECCFECGPDHKKNFLFKVILNGMEYQPTIANCTKKQAKADAASVCLQQLGLLS